jgi:phage repressor protein C with HTH and peptisase S24 domain
MTLDHLNEILAERGVKNSVLSNLLGISPDKVSKARSGVRKWTAAEVAKITRFLEGGGDMSTSPDLPEADGDMAYVSIRIVPSYAGAGGGGSGDGDQLVARLPRSLIEEDLRGRASDFELIDVRGDSMAPDFQHGDQILIDLRDRNPLQPGPFVLWDDDGYVVKLVERAPARRGWYRIFSANERYSAYEVEETETTIRGRPVWFARRL